MAYMSKEHKARIAAELKKIVPAGWKYSLAIRNNTGITMTIRSAPVDILAAKSDPEIAGVLKKINTALNLDNYDRSDVMTDYFDIGHYVRLNILTGDTK